MAFITHIPLPRQRAIQSLHHICTTSTTSTTPFNTHLHPTKRVHPITATAAPTDHPARQQHTHLLQTFLDDAWDLGTIRFINISNGAVLETIGRFDYSLSTFTTPNAFYLTLASADKTFECHINLSKASVVTMATEKAKIGHHDLHVIRILDMHDTILLSCLLQYDPSQGPGHYLHGAVDAFNALKEKYGPRFSLC